MTQLTDQVVVAPDDLRAAVAPDGGHIAFITGTNRYYGLTLNIISLPDGEARVITSLTSDESEPDDSAEPGDPSFEAVRTIVDVKSIAWSPDGQYLAFMGVMEGPTSDMYVYSLLDDSIVRLTDGPSQGMHPSWSPDGKYIIHAGVRTLGTGAGFSMEGVWAARADDTKVTSLYDPTGSGNEVVVGWVDEKTFVVYSWHPSCGKTNLRTFDVETGKAGILWEDFFNDVAFDPDSGNLLLAVNEIMTQCNTDGRQGLFLVGPETSAWRVLEDEPQRVSWSAEAGLFFAATEFGTVAISSQGDSIQLFAPSEHIPMAAAKGNGLAWIGEGLWVAGAFDELPRKVFTERSTSAMWGPQGEHLLFVSDGGLYVAQGPDFEPELVAKGFESVKAVWMRP